MHRDHHVFERGLLENRKIKVTFFSEETGREFVSLFAPLFHSKGREDPNEPECYYLWDFQAVEGLNFTALSPSEIVSIDLTEEPFSLDEILDSRWRDE